MTNTISEIRLIAYFLPQFYETPENNKWWGEGFTEWTNTKKAKPLFAGHYQPRTPLNNYYYDLSQIKTQMWQTELAKKYGLYGFSYYHYWFKDGERMLEKPEQQLLANPELDFPFCLCWANEGWSRRWDGSEKDILMEQDYGGADQWKKHFLYLIPYFKDKRYIRNNDNPIFIIYRPELIDCLEDMLNCWDELAKENGILKIEYIFQHSDYWQDKYDKNRFSFGIETQPGLSLNEPMSSLKQIIGLLFRNPYLFGYSLKRKLLKQLKLPSVLNYDKIWKNILKNKPKSKKSIACAFTDWDNSSRVGNRAYIFKNSSPENFEKYLSLLIIKVKNEFKNNMIFINAWNEWAEGAYLEPDERYGFSYLEAVRDALVANRINHKGDAK